MAVKDELRPEWQLFVNEYLVDLNATKAAQRAGFGNTEKSYGQLGFQLLKNLKIRKAIRREFKKRLDRIQLKQDRVIKELAIVALSDVMDYEVNEVTGRLVVLKNRQSSRAVSSVKVKKTSWSDKDGNTTSEVTTEYKLWDKLRAVELLMRHMGMLDDDKPNGKQLDTPEGRRILAERANRILDKRRSSLN